jgi:ABC-2 type transport system ATP-binding protein
VNTGARSVAGSEAVECRELVVRYGRMLAVDHLSFTARAGAVLAILGPNGAGKTSTLETLEGYRRPSGGTVRVLGLDPVTQKHALVARLGVMLQRGGLYPMLGPRRALQLFSRYYDDPEDPEHLLDLVGLRSVARTPWKQLSGGEQQRLSLALALVGRPRVLFLDEPTAGVDPEGRLAVRQVIDERRRAGVCVLLTTHELPEAERLADEVVILAAGRAVASGTVAELGRAESAIRFSAPAGLDVLALAAALGAATTAVRELGAGEYVVAGEATPSRLAALAAWFEEHGLPLTELRAGRGSLEDVYLALTGRAPVDGREGREGREGSAVGVR